MRTVDSEKCVVGFHQRLAESPCEEQHSLGCQAICQENFWLPVNQIVFRTQDLVLRWTHEAKKNTINCWGHLEGVASATNLIVLSKFHARYHIYLNTKCNTHLCWNYRFPQWFLSLTVHALGKPQTANFYCRDTFFMLTWTRY